MALFARRNDAPAKPAAAEALPPEPVRRGPDPYAELRVRLHERLIQEIDLEKLTKLANPRPAVEDAVAMMIANEEIPLSRLDRQRVIRETVDDVLGLGPIEPLLQDPTVSEVMVNRFDRVYVEREGRLYLTDVTFRDPGHILRIIERIIAPLGRHVDEASPMVDARLTDGSRVNGIIPPLAVDSPTLTIRKFRADPFTVDDLVRMGTVTPEMALFIQACVRARLNLIVSGGTGSGKTTLLNVLSSFIPEDERIVTIEDPCELQLQQPHVIRLETRPPNVEGRGEVTQRQLVKNSLRMRPNRIIVGEVRSGEAFDMLQAMNTGHEGSLTTVHANSPRDALARIENMILMANLDLPIRAVREQVSSAINLIVHLSRLRDGTRRVTHVTEIAGMEGDIITLQDIFLFRQIGVDAEGKIVGRMLATGLRPKCADRFEAEGIALPANLFTPTGGDRAWK